MARRLIIRLIATSGNEAKDPNKSLLSGIISGVARAARELVKAACLAAQYMGKKFSVEPARAIAICLLGADSVIRDCD